MTFKKYSLPLAPILRQALVAATVGLGALSSACAIDYVPWPTNTQVVTADASNQFGENMSGLYYQAQGAVLWAVQNSPSKLYKLTWNGSVYTKASGWTSGKTLRYPDGSGSPDAEGITMAEPGSTNVYVATERNGSGGNRFSVLRYDTATAGSTLNAAREWNLTADLPRVNETNLGLEGIAWVPDSYLVASQFHDQKKNKLYNPADYPSHGSGLFLVSLEANGRIYAYALNQTNNTYNRVAEIASGLKAVMDLSFDGDNEILWAWCDDTCKNKSHLLAIDTDVGSPTHGQFVVKVGYKKPRTLGNSNNEGIAIAPESECAGGRKTFLWADDSEASNHVIRRGTIPCGPLF